MDTQNLLFKMGFIRDAEIQVWDAKNFGPVSPGTHRSKFVKKITGKSTRNWRKVLWEGAEFWLLGKD